jgi:hypothetical protein
MTRFDNIMQDPISPHSARLVSYMNGHPQTLLGYAKYYGDAQTATNAQMLDIDSSGIILEVTMEDGRQEDVHVKFKTRLQSYEQVRPVLEEMAKEAETALELVGITRSVSLRSNFRPIASVALY